MGVLYRKLHEHPLLSRVLMVPVCVGVCYLYDWHWLRVLTTVTLVHISGMLGIPMQRIGIGVISVAGISAQFVVACTMVDAFFGAIPLLWRTRISWMQNVLRLGPVAGGVFLLNITRLELGFMAMNRGAPWWLAHEVVAGVTYFGLYLFILRQRAWNPGPMVPKGKEFRAGYGAGTLTPRPRVSPTDPAALSSLSQPAEPISPRGKHAAGAPIS